MKLPILSKYGNPEQRAWTKGSTVLGNPTNVEVKLERVNQICRRQRRGAAAVEFAIVVPLFFLLVFGMIEYGRMIMVQQILTNASREGARVGVLDPPSGGTTKPSVLSTVNNYLAAARISGATITTVPDEPSDAIYNGSVTVTVSVPFGSVSWLPTSMFGNGDKILQASTVMRRETVQ